MVRNKRTFDESFGEKVASSDASSALYPSQIDNAPVAAQSSLSHTMTSRSSVATYNAPLLNDITVADSCGNGHSSYAEVGYSNEQYIALQRNESQSLSAFLQQRYHPQQTFRSQLPIYNSNSTQFSAILPQMFPSSYPIVYIPVPLQISDAVIRYVHSFQLFDQQQRQYHQKHVSMPQLPTSRALPFLPQHALTEFSEPLPTPAGFSMRAYRDTLLPSSLPPVSLSMTASLETTKSSFEKTADNVAEPTTLRALNLVDTRAVLISSVALPVPEKRAKCVDTGAQTTLSGTLPEALVFCPPLSSPSLHEEASEISTEREMEQEQKVPEAAWCPTYVPVQDNNALYSASLADSASSEQHLSVEESPPDCDEITNTDEGKEEEIEEEVVKAHKKKVEDLCVVVIASACRAEESAAQNGSDGAGDKLEAMAANLDAPAADAAPILVAEPTQKSIISQNEATLENDTFDADQEQVSALKDSAATRPISTYPKRIRKSKQDTEEMARLAACNPAAPYITTIGPNLSTSISSSGGAGADAEAWRQQVRYHWHGTLLFDPERCVQVWRGSWLGTIVQASAGKKRSSIENESGGAEALTEEAFNATETIFEYLSTKVNISASSPQTWLI